MAEQFDISQALESAAPDDGAKEHKRFQVGENTEALAKAVFSLAPTNEEVKSKMEWMTASKAEHKKKVELLTDQTNYEKNQEKWDLHSCGGAQNARDICLILYLKK